MLDIADLDADTIAAFLDHLQTDRGNTARTRNARLAAIHSLYRYAALRHPEHAHDIQRVLSIPPKRTDRALVTFLDPAEIAETAHGVNLDLGAGLLTGLSTVDPADMAVARFFVYGLMGSDYDNSPYTQTGEHVTRLAMSGIRLVIDEFRTDVTKTRKDGSAGKLRIDYGDRHQPEAAVKWLWRFVDGAKTAGELYGRGLVVIAAESTPHGSWFPRANGHIRVAGRRTRITQRRC